MDQYLLILLIAGVATFSVAWMPKIAEKTGISYSVFYVLAGFLIFYFQTIYRIPYHREMKTSPFI